MAVKSDPFGDPEVSQADPYGDPEETQETPQSAMEKFVQGSKGVAGGLAGGAIGAAGLIGLEKGIPMASRVVGSVPKVWSDKQGTEFAKDVRKSFVDAHTKEVNKFGKSIDELMKTKPTGTVDLTDLIDDIKAGWNDMPNEAKTLFNKTPVLRDLIKDPTLPRQVSLEGSQKAINYLNKGTKHLDVKEAINSLRGEQLANFPEMADVRSGYAKFIEPFKQVKRYFKVGKTLGGIETKFGGAEGMQAIKEVLPPEVVKKIGAYRWASALANPSKWIPRVLGLGRGIVAGVPEAIVMPKVLESTMGTSDPRLLMSPLTGDRAAQEEFIKMQQQRMIA